MQPTRRKNKFLTVKESHIKNETFSTAYETSIKIILQSYCDFYKRGFICECDGILKDFPVKAFMIFRLT